MCPYGATQTKNESAHERSVPTTLYQDKGERMPFLKIFEMSMVWGGVIGFLSVITRQIRLKDRKRGAFVGSMLFFLATLVGYFKIQQNLVVANNVELVHLQGALLFITITWASIGGNLFVKIFDD